MATGHPEALPRLQTSSHCVSWGQTRPQMAGRALVSLILRTAAAKSPFSMSLMKLGMSMATGQPQTH